MTTKERKPDWGIRVGKYDFSSRLIHGYGSSDFFNHKGGATRILTIMCG